MVIELPVFLHHGHAALEYRATSDGTVCVWEDARNNKQFVQKPPWLETPWSAGILGNTAGRKEVL